VRWCALVSGSGESPSFSSSVDARVGEVGDSGAAVILWRRKENLRKRLPRFALFSAGLGGDARDDGAERVDHERAGGDAGGLTSRLTSSSLPGSSLSCRSCCSFRRYILAACEASTQAPLVGGGDMCERAHV
jgi:hypothetical protein